MRTLVSAQRRPLRAPPPNTARQAGLR
jgi:hypothetical protein